MIFDTDAYSGGTATNPADEKTDHGTGSISFFSKRECLAAASSVVACFDAAMLIDEKRAEQIKRELAFLKRMTARPAHSEFGRRDLRAEQFARDYARTLQPPAYIFGRQARRTCTH